MNIPPLNKIPGATQAKEHHMKDLKAFMYHELLEIRDRQINLLAYKKRLEKLPDKGKRIQESYVKVLAEIKARNDVDATAKLLGELNIASRGKIKLNNLEWHGHTADDSSNVDDILDSDDEQDMDPLRVIAQGTMHQRQIKLLPPPATLITPADLADIALHIQKSESLDSVSTDESATCNSSGREISHLVKTEIIEIDVSTIVSKQPSQSTMEHHALYLIEKTEQAVGAKREKFKPYRTTVSNVHDPGKEKERKKGKHWEITAATPPFIQHKEVQLVPLAESASLQIDYMQKVKDLRVQQAEQRLASKTIKVKGIRLPEESELKTKPFQNYRDQTIDFLIEGRQRASEKNEVLDPTIAEKPIDVL